MLETEFDVIKTTSTWSYKCVCLQWSQIPLIVNFVLSTALESYSNKHLVPVQWFAHFLLP
jgi:hypothetical protein